MNASVPERHVLAARSDRNDIGRVSLVGAGPGDPDLLTVRAMKRLGQADVVVYDNLVGDDILELIPHHVERIYVGKESSNHSVPQDKITELLIRLAQSGRRVVRLKGGDPFVFGRGGEELRALADCGIPVEIVPGITAALGAGAGTGIPLTHRDYAQRCVFVTGHLKDGSVDLDWQALARPGQTIVIYMGIAGLAHIATQLVGHGLPNDTPVALIRNASRADQEAVIGTLDNIAERAISAGMRPPAVIIVGGVVSLHEATMANWIKDSAKAWDRV
jgi:uroporphyrin-III C-methyltransferase